MDTCLKSFHVIVGMPELRITLKDLIEYHGYKAKVFDSIESYLSHFHSTAFSKPVAILIDYKMAKQTGMKVVETIRKSLPTQKIVLLASSFGTELNTDIKLYSCQLLALPNDLSNLPAILYGN